MRLLDPVSKTASTSSFDTVHALPCADPTNFAHAARVFKAQRMHPLRDRALLGFKYWRRASFGSALWYRVPRLHFHPEVLVT
ncbi:hypothetical protein S40288_10569 [Stachybotrys chartarum IBT 40288]|nr:hypothetical protein S40288_10569 [Stachybotrys chartarum IBT 40288]